MVIVIMGIGSQPALGAWLTAVPGSVKPFDPHHERLKQLLDNVAVGIVEVTADISLCESSQIAHAVDEELRVGDAVSLL